MKLKLKLLAVLSAVLVVLFLLPADAEPSKKVPGISHMNENTGASECYCPSANPNCTCVYTGTTPPIDPDPTPWFGWNGGNNPGDDDCQNGDD